MCLLRASIKPTAKPHKGKFTEEEDKLYVDLLNKFGQPIKANKKAWKEFGVAFHYRSEHSWPAHANAFMEVEDGVWVKR